MGLVRQLTRFLAVEPGRASDKAVRKTNHCQSFLRKVWKQAPTGQGQETVWQRLGFVLLKQENGALGRFVLSTSFAWL